jgi:hypothetical protein
MAIIIRRITNNLNYSFTIPCPGENNNQNANLIIPASVVDLDLLTLTTVKDALNTLASYTPAVPGNWTVQPTTVAQALDMIAAKIGPV